MRKILVTSFILLTIGISCSNNETKIKADENEKVVLEVDFDWLLGKWERTNDEEGKQTFEQWNKKSDIEYVGFGWTIQNGDTVFQEKIKLHKQKDDWKFGVISPEETEYTNFMVIQIGEDTFTCENPKIDFPNRIKYWKDGDKIKASVSGNEMEMTFEFEKFKVSEK